MALAVLAMLVPLCIAVHAAQAPQTNPAADAGISAFLEKNREALDLSDAGARFDARLLDVAGKQIVLLGEDHGIALHEDLDLALLRYLHQAAGVRVYLAEMSYAEGCLFNRYLDTGDEPLLDYLTNELRGTVAWTKEHRAFFVNLRRWNLTLPEKDRVHFAGVDIEHQRRVALHYLRN
jgi:erythromycin esterase-like protein